MLLGRSELMRGGRRRVDSAPKSAISALFRAVARLTLVGCLAVFAAPTNGFAASKPTVTKVRAGDHPDRTRLVLEIDGPITFSFFTLVEPSRLVVDFPELDFDQATDLSS